MRGAGLMMMSWTLRPGGVGGSRAVGFVTELAIPTEAGRYSAEFAVHVEFGDGDMRRGPMVVPMDAALAWARDRADVVYVQLGGDREPFSAGRNHPDPKLRRWPAQGVEIKPRPRGTPYNGTTQTAVWRVTALLRSEDERSGAWPSLRQIGDFDAARGWRAVEHPGSLRVVAEVEAGSMTAAVHMVNELIYKRLGPLARAMDISVRASE